MPKVVPTDLICPDCGNVFTIMRKESKQKKEFHRKWLYCPKCHKKSNHIEVRDLDIMLRKIEQKEKSEYTEDDKKVLKLVKKRESKWQ